MVQNEDKSKSKRGQRRKWLTNLFQRTHKKPSSTGLSKNGRTSGDNPPFVSAQTESILDPLPEQSKQISPPVGLWEKAAESLDPEDRKNLETLVNLSQNASHDQEGDFLDETIDSVLAEAKKLKAEGREATWRPFVDRIIERCLVFKSLGDAAVKFDTSGYAALGWSVVSLGLTFAANARDAREFALSSSEVITRYMAKCRQYERVFRGPDAGDEFDDELTNVCKAVLLYILDLVQRLAHGIYKPDEHSIVSRKKAIDAADAEISGWLVTISQMRSENYFSQVRSMIQNQDQPKIPEPSQQCLKSLSFPEMDRRFNDIDHAADGTCKWLLVHDAYRNWADGDCGLLCIKGKPGSGKSTLLRYALGDAIVASKIQDRPPFQNSDGLLGINETTEIQANAGALVLSFFFHDRGTELQKTTLGLFRSLLHQLLCYAPHDIPDKLLAVFKARKDKMGEPGQHWNWHWRELQEFFQASLGKVLKSRPVWLFIDALDEYGEENANELIKSVNSWIQEFTPQAHFRVCLTCRHYPPLALPDGRLEICLDDENEYDIFSYVQTRLSAWSNDKNLAAIRDDISNRASGVFMWARLIVERVLDLKRHGENWMSIKEAVDKSPDELDDLYRDLVKTMEAKPNSFRLMTWICFAIEPLTLDELRWAMVVDPNYSNKSVSLQQYETTKDFSSDCEMMEMRLRSLSCGLAEAVPSSRVVQFIHQTVKDFFIQEGLLALQRSQQSDLIGSNEANLEATAHYQLSRTCIRYLSAEEILRSDPVRPELLDAFPLLRYAATHWLAHVQQSENYVPQNDLVRYFDWPSEDIFLLCRDVSLSIQERDGIQVYSVGYTTLLQLASQHRWMGPLQDILKDKELLKTRINASNGRGTPLCLAAGAGHEDVVRMLLDNGADVNARCDWLGHALYAASTTGQDEIVRILLDNGADVNAEVTCGHFITALQTASACGYEHIVRLLLENGADANARGAIFHDALSGATLRGQHHIVLLLLEQGIDPDARSKSMACALEVNFNVEVDDDIHIENPDRVECVRILLERGADANCLAADGESLLVSASSRGSKKIMRMLLEKGADVNARSKEFNNSTALQVASDQGNREIVQMLLDYGAEAMNSML